MTKTATPKPDFENGEASAISEASLKADKAETVRRCIVSGKTFPKRELIRFCVSPDRELVPDLANKLPGRGIWIFPFCTPISEMVISQVSMISIR